MIRRETQAAEKWVVVSPRKALVTSIVKVANLEEENLFLEKHLLSCPYGQESQINFKNFHILWRIQLGNRNTNYEAF